MFKTSVRFLKVWWLSGGAYHTSSEEMIEADPGIGKREALLKRAQLPIP
ncbi:hypothetical protein [Rhodohalobacter sp. SW132]|nr:hypothetical protein [Rhodohalobacter sp. SW132]